MDRTSTMNGSDDERQPSKIQRLLASIQGTVFYLSLLVGGLVGTVIFLPGCICLQLAMPRYGRYVIDFLIASYLYFGIGLYENLLRVKVRFVGDVAKLHLGRNLNRIYMSNHRTGLDWLYSLSMEARYGGIMMFKAFLKREIKFFPGVGWAMQCACFIFLHRKWELDQKWIKKVLTYFRGIRYKVHLLFFPEGTTLGVITKGWTRDYAKKYNLKIPDYKYVLYPKTTGFVFTVQTLRDLNMLDEIADVTVIYPENIVELETDVFKQGLPREVLFHVKMFNNEDIPTEEEDLKHWLLGRWEAKERLLTQFYEEERKLITPRDEDKHIPYTLQISAMCMWYFLISLFAVVIIVYPVTLVWFGSVTIACVLASVYYSLENVFIN